MTWLIDNFNDLALALANYISQMLELLLNCAWYPFQLLFYWLSAIFTLVFNTFTGFINILWNNMSTVYSFFIDTLLNILPYKISVVIFLSLSIIFIFRLYHFLKDISILGFKI